MAACGVVKFQSLFAIRSPKQKNYPNPNVVAADPCNRISFKSSSSSSVNPCAGISFKSSSSSSSLNPCTGISFKSLNPCTGISFKSTSSSSSSKDQFHKPRALYNSDFPPIDIESKYSHYPSICSRDLYLGDIYDAILETNSEIKYEIKSEGSNLLFYLIKKLISHPWDLTFNWFGRRVRQKTKGHWWYYYRDEHYRQEVDRRKVYPNNCSLLYYLVLMVDEDGVIADKIEQIDSEQESWKYEFEDGPDPKINKYCSDAFADLLLENTDRWLFSRSVVAFNSHHFAANMTEPIPIEEFENIDTARGLTEDQIRCTKMIVTQRINQGCSIDYPVIQTREDFKRFLVDWKNTSNKMEVCVGSAHLFVCHRESLKLLGSQDHRHEFCPRKFKF